MSNIDPAYLLIALAVISSLTTLTTEAIKKLLKEAGKKCAPNLLAVIVSLVITVGVSIGYIIMNDIAVTAKVIVGIVAMVFLAFLCATVGFDKVKQLILQLNGDDPDQKDDEDKDEDNEEDASEERDNDKSEE